jgi:hypothetical protein
MNEVLVTVGGLLFSVSGGGFVVVKFFLRDEGEVASDLRVKHGWERPQALNRVRWWRRGLELGFVLLFVAAILVTMLGLFWFAIEK